jgi:hypothetical protein
MLQQSGFLTLAYGERYAEMALDLALSVKEFHQEPISIVADKKATNRLNRYLPSPFDKIITVNDPIHPWGAKLLAPLNCPYSHAAFIDCDVLFLRKSNFLEYEFKCPLAMYGAYMAPEDEFQTYFHSKDIFTDFKLKRYFWATSGIFFFKTATAAPFFKECYNFYTEGIKSYPRYSSQSLADEFTIGVMSNTFTIDSIKCETVHPWPMADKLADLQLDDSQWPVLHIFSPVNEPYMKKIISDITNRRRNHGFSLNSEQIWRNKANGTPTFYEKLRHLIRNTISRFRKRAK